MVWPKVSIIIVNYNGEKFINDSLDSLRNINYPKEKYEVIVVDNGSKDNSVSLIKKRNAWVKLIETGKNLGYAGGNNVGVKAAKGKYLVFLNPDTVADKNFLKELVKAIESDKTVGAFSSKVLYKNEKNKVNTIGGFWSVFGISGSVGEGKRDDELKNVIYTFYPTGCSMIIDKSVYLKLGKFDDDYFLYCEDPDLGWRLWDNGYKVALAPESKVYHLVSASLKGLGKKSYSSMFYFYNTRNGLITIMKNATLVDMFWMIPLYVISWLTLGFLFLIKGKFRPAWSIVKGLIWTLTHIRWVIKKRLAIKTKRTGKAKYMMTGFVEALKIFFSSKLEKHFS